MQIIRLELMGFMGANGRAFRTASQCLVSNTKDRTQLPIQRSTGQFLRAKTKGIGGFGVEISLGSTVCDVLQFKEEN